MAPKTTNTPLLVEIPKHGYLQGQVKVSKSSKKRRALCYYFGGVPYARPPTDSYRWKRPQPLPTDFNYGSKTQPRICISGTGVCPQPDSQDRSVRKRWSEDCLQSNIWVPLGKPPTTGWPVLFFLHGGFLQWGHPNNYDFSQLLGETDCKCIVVTPAYRLNAFGFLSSYDLQAEERDAGNYGFWDQRLALEWTVQNIKCFGGNPNFITLGGFSAGGYSAFHQLAYDLLMSPNRQRPLIKRVFIQSNGPGLQPRSVLSAQDQFDELLGILGVPLDLSSKEKLATLRSISAEKLIDATEQLELHEFRAVSDNNFVSKLLFDRIDDGTFAGLLKKHGIEILFSEVKDECSTYAEWRPPRSSKLSDLRLRLKTEYYPEEAVDAIVSHHRLVGGPVPPGDEARVLAFGEIYSGVQVHFTQRGFVKRLASNGACHLVRRVRTEWMTSTAKRWTPSSMGVTHGTDTPIWFWGNGEVLEEGEKGIMKAFVAEFFWTFLNGEDVQQTSWWKCLEDPSQIRTIAANGDVANQPDFYWEDGIRFWDAVRECAVYET